VSKGEWKLRIKLGEAVIAVAEYLLSMLWKNDMKIYAVGDFPDVRERVAGCIREGAVEHAAEHPLFKDD
jgi:hypothetical protein